MLKRTLPLLVILVFGFAVSMPAQAGKRETVTANATIKLATISQTGSPPASGNSTSAGIVRGGLGRGAIISKTAFGPVPTFKSTSRTFFPRGSLKSNLTGSGTINPDGSASFSGKGNFVSGTGIYKGATGRFTFTGSTPANSQVSTFNVTGSVTY